MADQPPHVTVRSAVTAAGVTSAALLLAAAAAAPAVAAGQPADHSSAAGHSKAADHRSVADHSSAGQDDASGHNPAGNNGTVKIHDVYGDTAHHNVPHVDCDFAVAFWGFDAGQTLTVSFAGQAPTGKDTPLTVTGAPTSITSPDDAGGGLDDDGELDFTADQFDLASLGDPHPQQGYHVKLTVTTGTPGGHKYKVFWLQPCTQPAATSRSNGATESGATESGATTSDTSSEVPQAQAPDTSVLGESVTAPTVTPTETGTTPTEVLGLHVSRNAAPAAAPAPAAATLPFTGAEIGGMAAAAAIALGAGAVLTVAARRRRTSASVSES